MIPIQLELDASFFMEEEICGYKVTKQRKEIWAIELDLLAQLDKVCKENGLRYCVGAGTLLGVVRHKGFIPWDDDIDVYMERNDYDKLMSLSDQFKEPYFLQNSYTEENLLRTYTRLRNGLTTGTTKMDEYRLINKGIFIDICPIDGVSPNKLKDTKQYLINKLQRKLFECYNASKTPKYKESISRTLKRPFKVLLSKVLIHDKIKFFNSFENNLKKYSVNGTEIWGNRSLNFKCPRSRRPISDYQQTVDMPFECLMVPVPRNYDSMLRQQYGDYMKIPKNKGENMHGELIISTDYSYEEWKKRNL